MPSDSARVMHMPGVTETKKNVGINTIKTAELIAHLPMILAWVIHVIRHCRSNAGQQAMAIWEAEKGEV
ncbi:hypothetical protein GCM10007082_28470 [Oceanisphaera arctica]|nr:hypothetical protein GCM10007082_28470 [Oceanisphaera arctica]